MRRIKNKKAQAVVELALFGSLVLFIFGVLLSYLQRFNDQQYVQMETFRRALEKANYGQESESEGAGASVQYSFIENRKHIDLQGGFRKGNTQAFSASSSVFWAVPEVGGEAQNLIAYKVNEDENVFNFRELSGDSGRFEPLDISTDSEVHFKERLVKEENPESITNRNISQLQERIHTQIPYSVDGAERGMLVDFNQHLFKDTDGQYKFSSKAPDLPVIREKQWETKF